MIANKLKLNDETPKQTKYPNYTKKQNYGINTNMTKPEKHVPLIPYSSYNTQTLQNGDSPNRRDQSQAPAAAIY